MKKRYIKALSILLAIFLLTSPLLVFGEETKGEGEASLLQEGDYDIVKASSVQNSLIGSVAGTRLKEKLYTNLKAVSSTIENLSLYGVNADDMMAIYSDVINDNSDLFYVSSSFDYYENAAGNVTKIEPRYVMTSAEIELKKAIFDAGAAEALAEVDDSMTDLQKALVIHDYICDRATYPILSSGTVFDENGNPVNDLDEDIFHSSFGFFYDQKIVCAGYSLVFSYLMHQLGIDCESVASAGMAHAWNKIKIDGNWYNIDATYDDFNLFSGTNTPGSVQHTFFLKSDTYFSSLDGQFHFDGKTYDDCECTSTTYDSAFFNDINTRIYVFDGCYFYIKPDYNTWRGTLTRRTVSGEETALAAAFGTGGLPYEGEIYDTAGNKYDIAFNDILAKLTYLDGRFYVAASQSMYAFVLNSNKTSAQRYTVSQNIGGYAVGASYNSDGNLIYEVWGDSTDYELDKAEYFATYITRPNSALYNVYPDINLDGYVNAKDYALIVK